ncbi:hypothetical protein ABTD44_20215, partial [Acinetobacter baumannii]
YVSDAVPLDELGRYIGNVSAVTPDQVRAAAAKLLDPAKASIVVVGDAKLFGDELRKAYPNAEVIPASAINLDKAALH